MREKINISQEWKFLKGDDSSSYLGNYNDVLWEEVNLPHCVELTPINCSGGRNYQGLCRYRKKLFLTEAQTNERILLEFEGAMQVLEVWVNNEQLQTHYCGYTPAIYDITDYIAYDVENTIAVRLDNSDLHDVPPGRPQSRLDFTYEGGLYKNVYIHRLPEVHISNAVLENTVAGGGILVTYDAITEASAIINVQTHLRNIDNSRKELTITQEVVDHKGNVVALTSQAKVVSKAALGTIPSGKDLEQVLSLDSGCDVYCHMALTVEDPILWSPFTPYLYELRTRVYSGNRLIDELTTSIGIRDFEFTKNGFYMNNEKIKMSGVNYHMTFPQIGNAMSDNLLRRDARKLREAGALNVRSHYPFPRAFVDECNKLGMTMIICNPGWQYFEDGVFVQRAYQNMRDIVRLLRNEPSVIIWEAVLNESKDMPASFQKKVGEIVHEELPLGPCYTGSDSGLSDIAYKSFDPGMIDSQAVNVHGMKITQAAWEFQVFGNKTDEEDLRIIEEAKAVNSDKPRWVREYGDCPDNFVDQNTVWRVPRAWGEELMVRQVSRVITNKRDHYMKSYLSCYNDEGLCGFGIWPGIEHNRGYHMNPCYGGFLDLQRIRKYSHYFYRSQRDPNEEIANIDNGPMVFIANSWSELSPVDITVYSNCQVVRLYHNDELIEERRSDEVKIKYPPFTFKGGFYYGRDRSSLRVEGLIDGQVVARDQRFSPGVTTHLHLYTDDEGVDMVADGSDIMFVRCEARDDHGSIVPLTCDNHELIFEVKGQGKLLGDSVKSTELGVTGIIVQATKEAGEIQVTAKFKHPQRNDREDIASGQLVFTTKAQQ